jgi:hypothetical protein
LPCAALRSAAHERNRRHGFGVIGLKNPWLFDHCSREGDMKKIQNRLFTAALIVAASDMRTCAVRAATHLLRRGERGDADSAGSTLRTIMVLTVKIGKPCID